MTVMVTRSQDCDITWFAVVVTVHAYEHDQGDKALTFWARFF